LNHDFSAENEKARTSRAKKMEAGIRRFYAVTDRLLLTEPDDS
jgi:hypothetical protein